jgi:hypothetical protein
MDASGKSQDRSQGTKKMDVRFGRTKRIDVRLR